MNTEPGTSEVMDKLEKYTAVEVEGSWRRLGPRLSLQAGRGGKGVERRPEELCGEGGRWLVRKYHTLSSVAN